MFSGLLKFLLCAFLLDTDRYNSIQLNFACLLASTVLDEV